jgi:hypothetical protein
MSFEKGHQCLTLVIMIKQLGLGMFVQVKAPMQKIRAAVVLHHCMVLFEFAFYLGQEQPIHQNV